jgi:predicted DNA binding protein
MLGSGPDRPEQGTALAKQDASPNQFGLPNGFGRARVGTEVLSGPKRQTGSCGPGGIAASFISRDLIRRRGRFRRQHLGERGIVTATKRTRKVKQPVPRAGGAHNGTSVRLRALRVAERETAGDRLLLATLRVRIPKELWTGAFSTAHPSVSLEVLNRADVSKDVSVSDYWISGRPPGVWAREISTFSDVLKVDSLAEVGDGSLYRVTYRNPPIIYLYRELGMPIQFPMRLQGGYIRWEVVARNSEFQRVLKHAGGADPAFQVVSIRRRPLRSHLPMLTETQQELLTQAMAAGYFAVPRGITLTDLARRLDRSKSAVSEAIAIIEKKLLESVLRPTTLSP